MSGSDIPLDRYISRLSGAGIPAAVRPPEELEVVVDPDEALKSAEALLRHTEDPEDTPVHHGEITAERRHEEPTPATSLDPDWAWFFLGLAYSLIGVDRSLFEVYQAAGDFTIPVRTHRSDEPLIAIKGVDFRNNPWAYIIQGIPHDHAVRFRQFAESYRFQSPAGVWCVRHVDTRIADPFKTPRVGADIAVAAPLNLQTGRGIGIVTPAGLALQTPVFGVGQLQNPE